MTHFKPNLIKAAFIASGVAFAASPALAQEENEKAVQDVEVISVSGIRGSLQRAQAIKMDNTSVVEALSAEDIGKLPDTSIAESLARLPGLAGERRDGRSSGLSVRGFNENYVGTSLNGRELLGMGDNRGVEYDLYPSEIVANVLVYKTPEAGLMAQGIGGTVDLQTIKPLGKERSITFNGSFEQNGMESANPDFDDNGHRFSLNYVDSFANDTLGVALTIASMESPSQEEQFRGWGYATANADNAAEGVSVPEGTTILGGHDSFVRSAMMKRDSIAAVVQYAPTDKLTFQLDALYIDFTEDKVFRGLEEGGAEWGTSEYTITGVEDGFVTSGYYDGYYSVIRNDAESKDAELTTFGLNVEYLISDDWSATIDLSTGDVDKTIQNIESYSGVGRAGQDGRPMAARSWTMTSTGVMYSDHPTIDPVDYTDESLITLAGPQAWGNPLFGSDAQDGYVNEPVFEESLDTARIEVEGFVDYGYVTGIKAGLVYSDRSKSKVNQGYYLTAPEYPDDGPIPDVLGVADLSFIGIEGILAYDALGLYNSGYYTANDAALVDNGRLGDTYEVQEKLLTLFTKVDLEAEFGDVFMRGNIGMQIVDQDQSSTGFSTVSNADGYTEATPVSGGADYRSYLPSLNLSFEIAEGQFIRTAMSRVESRPRMDDMRPNTQVSFSFNDNNITSTDPENGPWSGGSGNPNLRPLAANQFDLAYENYFADAGYFAVSFFFKDLRNWHRDSSLLEDFSDLYIPSYHQGSEGQTPATYMGFVSAKEDGLQGFVRGWELQASVPLEVIHESLEGFGIVASASFLDGKMDDGTHVPGLSEETYQLTAYYESNGWEFRVSGRKRSEFTTEVRGLSLALEETIDQGSELWDAQIAYDFSESGIEMLDGLRITLQGQNLTDEDTLQTNADPREVTKYQSFGANYLLGFNYEF